jgi:hypothetical protein
MRAYMRRAGLHLDISGWSLLATHSCYRAGEKLILGFRIVSDPSLDSPRFSRNMHLVFSKEEKDLWRKSHPVNICQMNSEKILSVLGY